MAAGRFILAFLFLFLLSLDLTCTTRVKGSFTTKDSNKVHYLTKFGVSKGSTVYMYGNATIDSSNSSDSGLLAFVPYSTWKLINQKDNKMKCPILISTLLTDEIGHNYPLPCDESVPCHSAGNTNELPSYMYFIENANRDTQFWYLLILSCNQVKSGTTVPDGITFSYDFHIVNDNPVINDEHHDPFTYQFSYDQHGFLLTYMTFVLLYTILVPVHYLLHIKYSIKCQTPLLIWLFKLALLFEAINILCGLIHYSVYSQNGSGVMFFYYLKGLLNLVGDWFLILVLILIAGGWMVTIRTIKWKIASFLFIGIYIFLSIVYYICSVVYPELEPWDTRHPLQNWAGGLYLAGRSLLLFYVWYQLYHIHRQEEKLQKLRLYRVLFVIFTAWFWYLPLVVAIITLINPVVAWVVLINIMNIMNFLVNVIMTALFCPLWSHEYFQFDHISNSRSSSVLLSSFGFPKQYTKIGDTDPHTL